MSLVDLFVAQLTDPFRIGLLVALMLTTLRTSAVSGTLVPLLAGVLFVAVIIPVTLASGTGSMAEQIGVGLASNAVILAVVLAVKAVVLRIRR